MTTSITIPASDAGFTYLISAQATGPQSAVISERATSKTDGSVKNTNWSPSNITIENGAMNFTEAGQKGTLSLYGDDVTIQTAGWLFGVGAEKFGPYEIAPKDAEAISIWMQQNFLHN